MNYYTNETIKEEKKLDDIYKEQVTGLLQRVDALSEELFSLTGSKKFCFFSAPGRTEICGNHTDHNLGKVLAASVNLDIIALAIPVKNNVVTLRSEGFDRDFIVDLSELEPVDEEKGTTEAIIRGVAAGLNKRGFRCGGFSAVISSSVLQGSGLSSSAAIEVLIGMIQNSFYNCSEISSVELAKTGQYAENNYFMKACGLMDQVACAHGSGVAIDFADPENPLINSVNADLSSHGYSLIIVDTGGSHDDLVPEYESVPKEMFRIAEWFGRKSCREVSKSEIIENISDLRKSCGDRSVLRAVHFAEENVRVDECRLYLNRGEIEGFLDTVNQSGLSSELMLQNCAVPGSSEKQELLLALEMTRCYMRETGCRGAFRVHGGGFAGTIQVFIPADQVEGYRNYIEGICGKGSVLELTIREAGVFSL